MPLITHLPASGYTAMPWRNGAGTTHEIMVDDTPGTSSAPFRWRLSMADLAGDDVKLMIDGAAPAPLGHHEAIAFPGDVPTSLTMAAGTGRDLNLMWDRTRAEGSVAILQIGDEVRIDAPTAFAIALGGSANVAIDDEEHVLGEQDALQVDDGGTLVVIDGEVYLATIA
jgi:environmental stress-induced protein Ves